MNTPVNFEIAKLLKEKEFNIPTLKSFYKKTFEDVWLENSQDEYNRLFNWNKNKDLISRPIISDVVMWLYEKHGIWASVNYGKGSQTWGYIICENENKENRHFGFDKLNQAYEAAIEYCLTNLI